VKKKKKGKIAKNEITTMGIYIVQVIVSTSDAHEIVASPVRALKGFWLVIATSIGLNTDPSATEQRGVLTSRGKRGQQLESTLVVLGNRRPRLSKVKSRYRTCGRNVNEGIAQMNQVEMRKR
jgi:hypothetical protein